MQYLESFPLWNVVLGGESEGENESNTANQFTADNICYKLFLLCGRLTNSRWKRWRGRVLEALPMWQAISGLCVISVPYSRQLASHAWLLHARRSMPTDGFLFPFPMRLEISHLNSEVQRRKWIQRKKNSCVVFSSSQCFARSVCSDQEALMGEFWVQARQAGSADAEQEVNSSVLYCHTSSCSYRKSQFIQSSLTVIWFPISDSLVSLAAGYMLILLAVARLAVISCIYYFVFLWYSWQLNWKPFPSCLSHFIGVQLRKNSHLIFIGLQWLAYCIYRILYHCIRSENGKKTQMFFKAD